MSRGSLVVVCLLGGCLYAPHPESGALECAPETNACPKGYECHGGTCWRPGDWPAGDDGPDMESEPVDAGVEPSGNMRLLGQACGMGTQCESGFCIDGVCCDRACDGQCEACDVKAGHCST